MAQVPREEALREGREGVIGEGILRGGVLREDAVTEDPMRQFAIWFEEAKALLAMPEAVALATSGADNRPSLRMVLARRWDERGFVFYTDYTSRKSLELEANPFAALVFYWQPAGRQVRVEGAVQRVSPEESDSYFSSRPRGSQLAAHASSQSRPVASRQELDSRFDELAGSFEGRTVPRPDKWGGYRVVPSCIEFWQQREDRLHDRLRYRRNRDEGGWTIERLQP